MPRRPVEAALRKLQADMRSDRNDQAPGGAFRVIPPDLQRDGVGPAIIYDRQTASLLGGAELAVRNDLHLEYLGDRVTEEVWRFACLCFLERSKDQVTPFLQSASKNLRTETALFPVHDFSTEQTFDFAGVSFLPLTPDLIPSRSGLDADPTCTSLIRVEAVGTSQDAMVARARREAVHALRILRVSLRRDNGINDLQLRFRLAQRYALGDTYSGWSLPPGAGFQLDLNSNPKDLVGEDALTTISCDTKHDVEKHVIRALEWLERARFEDDPKIVCLFLFFALEALLGNKSSEDKASHLCFYRSVLGEVAGKGFPSPLATYFLYAEVRSKAVHGSESADVSEDRVKGLEWDVRNALYQLVDFTRANNIIQHSKLLRALAEHETAPQVVAWLKANFPVNHEKKSIDWARFVGKA